MTAQAFEVHVDRQDPGGVGHHRALQPAQNELLEDEGLADAAQAQERQVFAASLLKLGAAQVEQPQVMVTIGKQRAFVNGIEIV